jgi:hypothetical protein
MQGGSREEDSGVSVRTIARGDYGTWELEGIYEDNGCVVHSKCLTCPIPQCVYGSTIKTNRALAYPHITPEITSKELAIKLNVSSKTAQKHLARYATVNGDFNLFLGVEDV